MREIEFTVTESESGVTALEFLKSRGFSRRMITALKASCGLTRSGELLRTVDNLRAGDVLRVRIEESGGLVPNTEICAAVVFEDADAVVFDKPPFLAVHPSVKHYSDTLGNLFAARYGEIPFRPINRLDRNTSGLCLCAKNKLAAAALAGTAQKVYFAVADGCISESGRIDAPIDREEGSIIRRCVRADGKRAVTNYTPLLHAQGRTLLRITLETGRTHQIRVHLAHIGFPLCGDELYGGDMSAIGRHALHCGGMTFLQPLTGERISVSAPLPEDMCALLGLDGAEKDERIYI